MIIKSNIRSPNYDARPLAGGIQYIILHYTELLFEEALERLCDPESKVSAHYLVKKDGEIYNLVDEQYKAWHAGISYWKEETSLNNSSVGIEIDNLGDEEFTKEQIEGSMALCKDIMQRHNIPRENVLGHSDIAPDRKIDPGLFFPWTQLEKQGIGILSSRVETSPKTIIDTQKQLQKLGYKIDVTGKFDTQTNYVFRAFQLRFCQNLIWHNGGLSYLRNPASIFKWDGECQSILDSLTR